MEEIMELPMEAAADMPSAEPDTAEFVSEPAVMPLPEQDLIDFVREYPGLDAATIPQHVWQAVKQGDSLTRAYGRHELQQLRQQNQRLQHQLGLEQARTAARNRSLGSMRSAGGSHVADSFLAGFNED